MSGNPSFQIEHHLFPDIPAHRYTEISDEVREVCERYGLQYNGGPLPYQLFTVARKIVRLAWPTGAEADAFVADDNGSRLGEDRRPGRSAAPPARWAPRSSPRSVRV